MTRYQKLVEEIERLKAERANVIRNYDRHSSGAAGLVMQLESKVSGLLFSDTITAVLRTVDLLPKTADGVSIVSGMNIVVIDGVNGTIIRDDVGVYRITLEHPESDRDPVIGIRDSDGREWNVDPEDCYSNREAALAALSK